MIRFSIYLLVVVRKIAELELEEEPVGLDFEVELADFGVVFVVVVQILFEV